MDMDMGMDIDMNTAHQSDVPRPTGQALDGASGESNPRLPAFRSDSSGLSSTDFPRRSSKGAASTTTQIQLNPHRVASFPIHDATGNLPEDGRFSETANVATLLPADEGFGAWSYTASAFSMFVVVWGFPQSFPIFQTYLASGDASNSTILLLLSPGIQDIEEGILFQIFPRSASWRQMLVITGISTMTLALLLASFATTPLQIFWTQGVLFGVGGIMLNFVHVCSISEWFEKKRKKAMAIIWLGYRAGAVVFPLVCQLLLEKHGYEKTLRVLIAPMLALLVPSVLLLRGRYPAATIVSETRSSGSTLALLWNSKLLFYLPVAYLFFSVVNIPRTFITFFGADLNLPTFAQTLALFLHVLCNMLSTYSFGRLSESIEYDVLIAVCAISTSLVHFLLWGFAKTEFGLYLYAVASGITSAGFSTCLYSIYSEVAGDNRELYTSIHSLFSFFRGIAVVSTGPIGVSILRHSPELIADDYGIGKYKYLVTYAGGMSMASGLLVLLRLWHRKHCGP